MVVNYLLSHAPDKSACRLVHPLYRSAKWRMERESKTKGKKDERKKGRDSNAASSPLRPVSRTT